MTLNTNHRYNNKVYTLVRGELETFDQIFLDRLHQLRKLGRTAELLEEIRDIRLDRNFGRIFFSVRFRVDRSINMTSVGFWGPSSGKTTQYQVTLIVSQYANSLPNESRKDLVLDRVSTQVQAEPKGIFQIPFSNPVHVKAGKWIRIQFQLDGPSTFICSDSSLRSSYYCSDSKVNFLFHMSSHQLPTINYTLA